MNFEPAEYSFFGLLNSGKPLGTTSSLGYLIGLVNSPQHEITQTLPAKRIINYLFEVEEQCSEASELLERQQRFFLRYFNGGYHPQTPVMLAKLWSPLSAMLDLGFEPTALKREQKTRSVATSIWAPDTIANRSLQYCHTTESPEALFWVLMREAVRRARHRSMLISVIAQPGWNYDTAIHLLLPWSQDEIVKADRILWKRRPKD